MDKLSKAKEEKAPLIEPQSKTTTTTTTTATTTSTTTTTAKKEPVPLYEQITQDPTKTEDYDFAAIVSGMLWDVAMVGLMTWYIYKCLYTKVEESFNLHAVHDLTYLGAKNLDSFDHLTYPGVVPRTFHGPLVVSTFLHFFLNAMSKDDKELIELPLALGLTRFILGMFVVHSLRRIRQSVSRIYGSAVGGWASVLAMSEFHLMFWGSRLLPNMFALTISNYAIACWIDGFKPISINEIRAMNVERRTFGAPPLSFDIDKDRAAKKKTMVNPDKLKTIKINTGYDWDTLSMLWFATYGALVFRLELLALFAPIVLGELSTGRLKFGITLVAGLLFGLISLASTVLVDSFFWKKDGLWPEGEVFSFNILNGRSSEYGVSPFHAYFTSLILRIAPLAYILSVYSFVVDPRMRRILLPAVFYVLVMSFIAHKEWRFIVYIVPLLNIAGGVAITRVMRFSAGLLKPEQAESETKENATSSEKTAAAKKKKTRRTPRSPPVMIHRMFIRPLVLLAIIASFIISQVLLQISTTNYPGGTAFDLAHKYIETRDMEDGPPYIHLDAYTCSNGASRFGEIGRRDGWTYSKNESHTKPQDYLDAKYSHLLTNDPLYHTRANPDAWLIYFHTLGFDRIDWDQRGLVAWAEDAFNQIVKGNIVWDPRRWLFGVKLPFTVVTSPKVYLLQRKDWRP